jgi:TolA-binding protein
MRKIFVFLLLFGVIAGAAAQDERIFREAERRYTAGDYRFALSRYQTLIEDYPRSAHIADAHYRRAVIYYRIGEPRRALEGLRRVEQRYPYTQYYSYLPFWRGVIRFELEEYSAAVEELDSYLQQGDGTFRGEALLYKAMASRSLGETETALNAAKQALDEVAEPESAPRLLELYASLLVKEQRYGTLYELFDTIDMEELPEENTGKLALYRAEALFRQERYEEAEPIYRGLLGQEGEAQRIAFKRLFVLYQRTGREEKREEIFDAAQSSLAGRPELLNEFLLRVGIESYKKERYDLAESYLRRIWRSTERAEADGLVPLYLAGVLERKGEYRRAAEMIEEYLQISDSREEDLLFALGRIYSTAGEWGKAAESLTTLFARYPQTGYDRKATYLLAFARYKGEEPRKALTVIGDLFRRGEEGELYGELLRLKSRLHLRLGELQEALDTLNEYLPLHPDDTGAYVDLARIRFSRGEYRRVLDTAERFTRNAANAEETFPDHFILTRYMEGLSLLALGEYGKASTVLETLTEFGHSSQVTGTITPHLLFYLGWSLYEENELEGAYERFTELIRRFPEHSRTPKAQYYAGWSAYARGDFQDAAGFFAGYGKNADSQKERDRGTYMHAQSLAAAGKRQDALVVYRSLFQDSPNSAFADEALYEYASQLEKSGRPEEAVKSYQRLHRQYPTSPLAEDALYTRGEVLYDMERWDAARDAFYEHRASFPNGQLLPLSLYWGGKAAENNDEPYGAALLWEKLVDEYPDSPLHRDALGGLARLYADQGEYEKALQHYTQLLSLYPEKARELGAEERIATLKMILQGKSEREAELQVLWENQGTSAEEGRNAALELAKMYLYRYSAEEERARRILEQLVREVPDTESGARAHYYLGEYHMKQGEWARAARKYFDAALSASGDSDFIARAMYRAAESAAQAGDAAGARRMVSRLESEFPHSQWAREGRALLRRLEEEGDG